MQSFFKGSFTTAMMIKEFPVITTSDRIAQSVAVVTDNANGGHTSVKHFMASCTLTCSKSPKAFQKNNAKCLNVLLVFDFSFT